MKLAVITSMVGLALLLGATTPASGDDLYHNNKWANVAGDRKATRVGDVLTVVVYQNAEARNAADNASRKNRSLTGTLSSNALSQSGQASLGGDYAGHGEISRSESIITQISVTVEEELPNGDLVIAGEQAMKVNGEKTRIGVRGRIRSADISSDNQIISTRIADAQINYGGQGFVSRNTRSGPIGWVFGFLGLGG